MDFRQASQPNSGRPAAPTVSPTVSEHKEEKGLGAKKKRSGKWMQLTYLVMLIGIAILVAAISVALTRGGKDNEFKYVSDSKYQAVFLNNGQVYFGHIDSLNGNYVHMSNIYYLTQSGDAASSNYSLVKLGCQQIHDPTDAMVINRSQVTFWENLVDSGKVVTSINQFKKQNPNGPDCTQVSNQTQASSSAATQGTNGTGTSTTGTGTSGSGSSTTK